jgi:alpha-1,4-N-acetylglucosaminyltransferase EXTL3
MTSLLNRFDSEVILMFRETWDMALDGGFPLLFWSIQMMSSLVLCFVVDAIVWIYCFLCGLARVMSPPGKYLFERDRAETFSILIPVRSERRSILAKTLRGLVFKPSHVIREIFLRWGENSTPPDLNFFGLHNESDIHVPVTILPGIVGFITERFLPPFALKTRTVLTLDDDILVRPVDLERAFHTYLDSASYYAGIVGPSTRACVNGTYKFGGKFNLILTNIAFMSAKMLDLFFLPRYKGLRQLVKNVRNCEDILMNYIAVQHFRKGPCFLHLPSAHLSHSGISTLPRHIQKRNLCCQIFERFFGRNGLQPVRFLWERKNNLYHPTRSPA